MAEKYKKYYPDPSEAPPIDIMPASNGEYVPPDPTPAQRKIMALQNEKIEEVRRKFGMSVWAVDRVTGGKWGSYAWADGTKTTKACDLENPGAQLANLPGEFILDTQGHALDSSLTAPWRTEDPGFSQFLLMWTTQAMGDYPGYNEDGVRGFGAGEIDPVENLGRYHYFKEIFLDSSETVNLLTALPHLPDEINITPMKWAAETRDMINNMTQSERCFVHAFSQPNRGYQGPDKAPYYQQEDFEWMSGIQGPLDVRGWKLYCGWGDPGLGSAPSRGGQRLVVRRRQRPRHRRAHPPDPRQDEPAGGYLHPQGPVVQRHVRLGQVLAPRHGHHRRDVPRRHLLHLPLRLRRRAHEALPR
jgi:uncharacterized protein